jgi:hypothetical protein
MKSKLKLSTVIVVFFASAMTCALAQPGVFGGAAINPATGLPVSQPQAFDPATGQPIAQSIPDWKDPNWKDPDITLTNVSYDNLSLAEIARTLSYQFKQQFDLLLPVSQGIDWRSEPVNLQLKNVTASEIFSAMNMYFENNRTPLRWELKINGHRQMALLRMLTDPTPFANPPTPEAQRRVYFVGNLIGDEKSGGMTMEQIIKTVTDVWKMADASGGNIQFHKDAQLLVVTGTSGQIDFMEQTLKALEQKVALENIKATRNSAHRQSIEGPEQKWMQEKTNSAAPLR